MRSRCLAGQDFEQCQDCGGVWIERTGVLAMRGQRLYDQEPLACPHSPIVRGMGALACPVCGDRMRRFSYRGGAVTADQCTACDRLFFDAGELSTVLREWDEGFELTDSAREALVQHHARQAVANDGIDWLSLALLVVFSGLSLLRLVVLLLDWGIESAWVNGALAICVSVGVVVYWARWQRHRNQAARYHVSQMNKVAGVKASKRRTTSRPTQR